MTVNRFDRPWGRLSTTDETGKRVALDPAPVRGRYQRSRALLHPVLLVVFLAIPWVRIGGKPLLLLDFEQGRYSLLGYGFGSHDTPMLVFLPVLFALTVALVTAVWGRAWCGWMCPQTVFIEAVFRRTERALKAYPAVVKALVFLGVSLVLSHTFIAYFIGTDRLTRLMLQAPTEAPLWFGFMAVVTAAVFFDFGWFREQFCVIACPYGRIQSALVDRYSRLVCYDTGRGEPRRGSVAQGAPVGDCVSCYRCVQVCPTGIDIRRGAGQLECIGCAACIDACDEVMEKSGRKPGLVRFASLESLEGGRERWARPRVLLLAISIVAVGAGLTLSATGHRELDVTFFRAVGAPYREALGPSGPILVNQFHAELWNGSSSPLVVSLAPGAEAAAKGVEVVPAGIPISVPAGRKVRHDFFVKFPPALTAAGKGRIVIRWSSEKETKEEVLDLVGPLH